MAAARRFTDLQMWQRARQWSKKIFRFTQREPFRSDRRLVVQVNDSSESVMSNIAEGFGRGTQGEFVVFLGYAVGSLDETQSHLCAAYDREYLSKDEFGGLFQEGVEIRKMTVGFIGAMSKRLGSQALAQASQLDRGSLGAIRTSHRPEAAGRVRDAEGGAGLTGGAGAAAERRGESEYGSTEYGSTEYGSAKHKFDET